MKQEDIDIRQLLPTGALLQGGKYRVERYLSSGNFGNTYIVQNTGMGVQFAMKEFFLRNICYRTNSGAAVSISPAVDPEKVAIQREKFKKEAQRLYGLKSQHLVHVHDMFEENGTVYYVMDFVKGESLASYMERKQQPLTEEQVRYILNQLLDGLEEIHQKQIWHLDLKPDNVMIDKDGNVVIIDFGASKQVGRSGKYTGTSNILCYTPGYAPKEQVNQNMEAIGPWTDIYALGATLYNLLTNIDPSVQSSDTLNYPTPVSPQMKQLIGSMMQGDLTKRPQSLAAIRQLLATPVGTATRVSPAAKTATCDTSSRKWLLVGLAAAVVVVLLVVLLGGKKEVEPVKEEVYNSKVQDGKAPDEAGKTGKDSAPIVSNLYYKTAYGACNYSGPVDEEKRPDGIGEAKFEDGRYYKGGFVHGVMEGDDVVYTDDEGNTFKGSFRANKFHRGTFTWAEDGTYFTGTFKDGQPDEGTFYDKNGNKL